MICSVCGGNVMWTGPWGSLTGSECQRCHGKNCQVPDTEGQHVMTCRKCKLDFDPTESTGGVEGIELCQDCWEAHADAEWWEAVKDLEPTGYPDEYRRVAPMQSDQAATLFPEIPAMQLDATLSECGRYRYVLVRKWGGVGSSCLVWIMLNPSTADAETDDQTIRKCMHYARREGLGGILVVNCFAYRATNPRELSKVDDPDGPMNWHILSATAHMAKRDNVKVVAAWGTHDVGTTADAIIDMFGDLWCLGTNKDGSPKHPCYLANNTPLVPFARGGKLV